MMTTNVLLVAALGAALTICAALAWRLRDYPRVGRPLDRERAHPDQLVEHSPEAIALVDPDDRVQRINREFTRLFGYDPGEVIGRQPNDPSAPVEGTISAPAIRR